MATPLRTLDAHDTTTDTSRSTLLPPPPTEERSGILAAVGPRTPEDDLLAWLDESLARDLDTDPDADDEEDDRPTLPVAPPDPGQ